MNSVLNESNLSLTLFLLEKLLNLDQTYIRFFASVNGSNLSLLFSLEPGYLFAHLCLNGGLHLLGFFLCLHNTCVFHGHTKTSALFGDVFVVATHGIRDARLSDTDGNQLNTSIPFVTVLLQSLKEGLVELLEQINVHLLHGVGRAELVDLVMDLIKDPRLIIVYAILFHGFPSLIFSQLIHTFNFIKAQHHTIGGATRNTCYHISLQCHLYFCDTSDGKLQVVAGLSETRKQSTSSPVHAHISLTNLMNTGEQHRRYNDQQTQDQRFESHNQQPQDNV
mmetsp:Transcript_11696/g.35688  ORF Transcript_11696/g.35688 Transcript_11696/m.35688 type:complete len:279 (-) Transcript_11696:32-868(-)